MLSSKEVRLKIDGYQISACQEHATFLPTVQLGQVGELA